MASKREVAASLAAAALDEYRRSGTFPPALVQGTQASAWRDGRTLTEDEVAAELRRYCEWVVSRSDNKSKKPLPARDEVVQEAVDYLATTPNRLDPHTWTVHLSTVERASNEGRLTRQQTQVMDALNKRFAAAMN